MWVSDHAILTTSASLSPPTAFANIRFCRLFRCHYPAAAGRSVVCRAAESADIPQLWPWRQLFQEWSLLPYAPPAQATGTELSGQQPNSNKEANAEERALRESLAELKSLFKTVLEALKRKQKTGHTLRDASPLRAYAALPESGGSLAITV